MDITYTTDGSGNPRDFRIISNENSQYDIYISMEDRFGNIYWEHSGSFISNAEIEALFNLLGFNG